MISVRSNAGGVVVWFGVLDLILFVLFFCIFFFGHQAESKKRKEQKMIFLGDGLWFWVKYAGKK